MLWASWAITKYSIKHMEVPKVYKYDQVKKMVYRLRIKLCDTLLKAVLLCPNNIFRLGQGLLG